MCADSVLMCVCVCCNRVAAVLQNEVHIYHFNNLNVLTSLYSVSNNEAGLCAISGAGDIVLGVCGLRPGMLHLERVDPATSRSASVTVQAHKNDLSCLGISPDGTLVATASSKGTLIRVFDTATGTLQREFRRGTHPAPITSLNFAADNSALVASSGSGTIHVFDMLAPHPDVCERGKNRDRSAIRFHTTSTRSISCFGSDSSVVIGLLPLLSFSFFSRLSPPLCVCMQQLLATMANTASTRTLWTTASAWHGPRLSTQTCSTLSHETKSSPFSSIPPLSYTCPPSIPQSGRGGAASVVLSRPLCWRPSCHEVVVVFVVVVIS